MTKQETLDLLTVMQAAYPNFYKGMNRQQADAVVNLWATMFAEEPAQIVAMAVKAHIASDTKGFPPHIGAIKEAIGKLLQPKEMEMSELEAWNLVRRAIKGASMADCTRTMLTDGTMSPPTAVVQFNRLPKILQQLVGDPNQLALWEALPNDEINTIIQSNFMRSWRARTAHEKELLALPSDVREGMQMIAEQNRALLTEGAE